MANVTVRDLRNRGGEVLARVSRGERVTVTRAGRPVAELRPLVQPRLSRDALVERRRRLPAVDLAALRADLDAAVDGSL